MEGDGVLSAHQGKQVVIRMILNVIVMIMVMIIILVITMMMINRVIPPPCPKLNVPRSALSAGLTATTRSRSHGGGREGDDPCNY